MKLVVQRVKSARLTVEAKEISKIGPGLLVLVGLTTSDTEKEADFLAEKLAKLRIMSDETGKMNLSVKDLEAEMLIVSQFTLYADTKGGNRPSYIAAARPEKAEPLYKYFLERVKAQNINVSQGQFGADMKIEALLDGPVTILLES